MKYTLPDISPAELYSEYTQIKNSISEWEAEGRLISDYLVPGRGILSSYAQPRKRSLTSPKVDNDVGSDALGVLTSGLHSNLTSPARPWFDIEWANADLMKIQPLKIWVKNSTKTLHRLLHSCGFYEITDAFYTEHCAYGNGCVYVGSDTESFERPLRFEVLTFGEYVYLVDAHKKLARFFRVIDMTIAQAYEVFGDELAENYLILIQKQDPVIFTTNIQILEVIFKRDYMGKPLTQVFFEISNTSGKPKSNLSSQPILKAAGFYEFPYCVSKFYVIGNDPLGVGPGSKALKNIIKLQEFEKALIRGVHHEIDPVVNIPVSMKGVAKTLPGSKNYTSRPDHKVERALNFNFDIAAMNATIEIYENRVRRTFYNHVFLTASRDPNASPYKAREVEERSLEKMITLGPASERLIGFFGDLISRAFSVCYRAGSFEQLPAGFEDLVGDGDLKINLVSPLAVAQRMVAVQQSGMFFSFLGQLATYKPDVIDVADIDSVAIEAGDIFGIDPEKLRTMDQINKIRADRAKIQMAQLQKETQMADEAHSSQLGLNDSQSVKNYAEASQTITENQQLMG